MQQVLQLSEQPWQSPDPAMLQTLVLAQAMQVPDLPHAELVAVEHRFDPLQQPKQPDEPLQVQTPF